jgi:hypothetical protein
VDAQWLNPVWTANRIEVEMARLHLPVRFRERPPPGAGKKTQTPKHWLWTRSENIDE